MRVRVTHYSYSSVVELKGPGGFFLLKAYARRPKFAHREDALAYGRSVAEVLACEVEEGTE